MRRLFLCLIFLNSLACVVAPSGYPQTSSTGKLSGTITDPSGAAIPSANVTVTDQSTGQSRTVNADGQGFYEIPLLPPANYSIEVKASGFSTAHGQVVVRVSESSTLPIQMVIGKEQQTVTVTEAPELLQTESSATGEVVEEQQVASLPLVARNFTQILGLSSGVAMSVTDAADIGRGSQSSESVTNGGKSVHGSRLDDNNFQINGIQVNDEFGAGEVSGAGADFGGGLPIPNPDTIQEFKEQTTQFDASYGRNAGGQINIITKGGTNEFHGSLWEFFRNEDLNANDFFRNFTDQPRGLLRQNQYGGTVGGPIVHDQLYFFGSYQGTQQQNGIASGCASTVFSAPLTNDRSAAALGALFGGQTGAFGGVAVAPNGSNINPIALELLQFKLSNGQYLFPTPQKIVNSGPGGTPQGISSFSVPCKYIENQVMGNLDYVQSSKSVFNARLFWLGSNENVTFNSANVPGFPLRAPNKFWVGSLTHTYTFNSRLINQIIFGANDTTVQEEALSPLSWNSLGITTPVQGSNLFGASISGSYAATTPFEQNTSQFDYDLVDLVSYTVGQHSLRFGGGLSRLHLVPSAPTIGNSVTTLSFPDFLLGLPGVESGAPVNNGTPLSNLFVGVAFQTLGTKKFRQWGGNLFVQDDWKAFRNLTINMGLRYEKFGDFSDELGRLSGFDAALADPNPPASGSLSGFYVNHNYPDLPVPAGVLRLPNDASDNGTHSHLG
jgi:Carboxypeptidase regulatory-like domain